MLTAGVYMIQSKAQPKRVYIGGSADIVRRWEQHLFQLKRNKHHSQKLQRHYNKYGKNDLVFSIIVGCDVDDLVTTEQYFIDVYKPYFNGRLKAYAHTGYKHTDEAKAKLSIKFKGANNANYGKKFSDEHRAKLSAAMKGRVSPTKGKKMSDEAKQKLSIAQKGKRLSPATEFKKGRKNSPEDRAKISAKLKGCTPWNKGVPMREESRTKLINSIKGVKKPNYKSHLNTPETKKKMSEARKQYYINKRLINCN